MLRNIIIAIFAVLALAVPAAAQMEVAALTGTETEMDFGTSIMPAPALPAGYHRGLVEESVASRQCPASCPCEARVWQEAITPMAEPTVRIWASDCHARQVIPDAWVLYRASALFPGATIRPYQP